MRSLTLLAFAAMLVAALMGCGVTANPIKDSTGLDSKLRTSVFRSSQSESVPSVIIAHGSGGVTANHYMWANKIKDWGFNAIVLDHYSERGITAHASQLIPGATPLDRARDFAIAIAWVRSQQWHRGEVVLIGFSQGGAGVLAFADAQKMSRMKLPSTDSEPPIAAAIFYPACGFSSPPENPRMPILMLLGEQDRFSDPGWCGTLPNKAYTRILLRNATHSFDERLSQEVASRLPFDHEYSQSAVD